MQATLHDNSGRTQTPLKTRDIKESTNLCAKHETVCRIEGTTSICNTNEGTGHKDGEENTRLWGPAPKIHNSESRKRKVKRRGPRVRNPGE